ncbi:peptidase M19 [candidate division KSB1 bacterium]|nr:peptidase M19 [candidate division KSB1 bacterium]NIR72593.1 peptidase M19 [candidate division KSB1 bacterium]NIS23653.1 peptidase M19 [candidate division KSB1 bacterium]NIT70577.1 peptidase M19 [candidate division KSB1 bacterium]NIU24295.1 peptidase M19 [candidate division KSB1 bacterium]
MKTFLRYAVIVFVLFLIAFFVLLPPLFDKFTNRVTDTTPSEPSSEKAKALHSQLWIADLHADALLWSRGLSSQNKRGHVDIPRLIEGNVALQSFTVVSKVPFELNFERNDDKTDSITLLAIAQCWPIRTWCSLTQRALYQAEKLHTFAEDSKDRFVVIKSKPDLGKYVARRQDEPEITAGFLGIEGAQALEGDLAKLRTLFDAGFRMMAPTHFFDTEIGGSAHGVDKGGLTEFGRQVIREMEQLGMIVDLAHASPKTIDDVLDMATKPVVVSHTGVKGTCDNIRNLSDQHLQRIAKTGGVIGIAYFEQATCGKDVAAIVDAIKYTAELVGVEHVALGSDFDGAVVTPFDTAELVRLTDGLLKAGFSQNEIASIMGGNVRQLLFEVLPD